MPLTHFFLFQPLNGEPGFEKEHGRKAKTEKP